MKEFELHFETRHEYIKSGNEQRIAEEKRQKEFSNEKQNKQVMLGNSNDPLKDFREKQKELLNEQTTSSSLVQSKETAKFLKPDQVNQTRQMMNPNARANQQNSQMNIPNRNNAFANNPFINNKL